MPMMQIPVVRAHAIALGTLQCQNWSIARYILALLFAIAYNSVKASWLPVSIQEVFVGCTEVN